MSKFVILVLVVLLAAGRNSSIQTSGHPAIVADQNGGVRPPTAG